MDLARIRDLLKVVAESGVAEVEIEEEGVKLVVRKNAPTVLVQPPPMMAPYGAGYPPQMVAPMPPMPPVYPQAAPAPAPMPNAAPVAAAAPPAPAAEPLAATLNEPEDEVPPPADEGIIVHAPIVGTFYEAPAPGADAFAKVGDTVQPGDVLCIIEAMKLMNEIESEVAGTVRKVLAQNAEPVEYDQPLFLIEPA